MIKEVIIPTIMKEENKKSNEDKKVKENKGEERNKQEKETESMDKSQKITGEDKAGNSKIRMQSISGNEDSVSVSVIEDEQVPLIPGNDNRGWIWFWVTFAFCEFLIIVGYKYNETRNKNKTDKKDL
jgi:hypothetical protein